MAFFKNNLNPKKHKTGDCAVRALSAAMNVPWEKVYVLLAQRGLELALDMTDPKVMESVLLEKWV